MSYIKASVQNNASQERVAGVIESVVFHATDTGFCVLKVKNKKKKEPITVLGNAVIVNVGEYVEALGAWINNREYGQQFKADTLTIMIPESLEGLEKYLGSGLIKGIGLHFAKKLVSVFGQTIIFIIENEPEKIKNLPGIGLKRYQKIIESWAEQKSVREIMVFLHSHGMGTARAFKIYKTYGNDAIDKISQDPYCLVYDVRGIGFKTADALAKRIGVPENSLLRARAGIHYVIQQHCGAGHCGIAYQRYVDDSISLLDISSDTIQQAIQEEIDSKRLMVDTLLLQGTCVFPLPLYKAEDGIASHIRRLLSGSLPWGKIEADENINWVEKKTGLKLSISQKAAISKTLASKVMVLTGGPGVGKTTVVNSILKIIETRCQKILLCAPTGRAAKRLTESTGHPAKTLHRLLNIKMEKDEDTFSSQSLNVDFLIVDEASMIDVSLMNQLLKAMPTHAGILIVGDVDQLPSIGSGSVLKDLIDSNTLPLQRLTEIFRQAKTSQIIVNAHRINEGKFPVTENKETDFYFIETDTPEKAHDILMRLMKEKIKLAFGFEASDIQVLSPMQKGNLGVRALNQDLQSLLNPSNKKISRYGTIFLEDDRVMQTVNNYDKEVFNGDMGKIKTINFEESWVEVAYEDKLIAYDFDELDQLSLSYAVTIHKSQGSEYPVVVIPVLAQHYKMLERNLLYTAVTRGKKLVILIGQKKAVFLALKNNQNNARLTRTKTNLQQLFG